MFSKTLKMEYVNPLLKEYVNPLLKLTKLYIDLTVTPKVSEELEEITQQIVATSSSKDNGENRVYVVTQSKCLPHLVEMAGFTVSKLHVKGVVHSFTIEW
jgi:hypothetical protein